MAALNYRRSKWSSLIDESQYLALTTSSNLRFSKSQQRTSTPSLNCYWKPQVLFSLISPNFRMENNLKVQRQQSNNDQQKLYNLLESSWWNLIINWKTDKLTLRYDKGCDSFFIMNRSNPIVKHLPHCGCRFYVVIYSLNWIKVLGQWNSWHWIFIDFSIDTYFLLFTLLI